MRNPDLIPIGLPQRWLPLLFGVLLITSLAGTVHARSVFYPRPESVQDKRTEYPLKLLEMALKTQDPGAVLVPTPLTLPQGRALKELSEGRNVDVVWSMTSVERESLLHPIRIPIYRGLIGWRLYLIDAKRQPDLLAVNSIDGLKNFTTLQGHDWPDTMILQANGFPVNGIVHYENIFKMLKANRGQLFPRSIIEIWAEAETHASEGIVVDSKFMLKYPTAFYYFVNKENRELATLIESGLQTLLHNGTFESFFYKYYGELIRSAKVSERQVFELHNPILPANTPLDNSALWHPLQ